MYSEIALFVFSIAIILLSYRCLCLWEDNRSMCREIKWTVGQNNQTREVMREVMNKIPSDIAGLMEQLLVFWETDDEMLLFMAKLQKDNEV